MPLSPKAVDLLCLREKLAAIVRVQSNRTEQPYLGVEILSPVGTVTGVRLSSQTRHPQDSEFATMTPSAPLLLVIGIVVLLIGAEGFVRGAAKLAAIVGLSPLIIGLTVVSYGTSAPELAVSLQSSYLGQGDIALGNVIGSNIFNILMILGLSSVVFPLTVAQQLIRLDVPIMIGISSLMLVFALDGELSRSDGIILLVGSVIYTGFLVYQGRKETNAAVKDEYAREYGDTSKHTIAQVLQNLGLLGVGLVLLVVGAKFLVEGAVEIAEALGLSQLIIGLTIVAAGTSMPELATSVVASYRGERDIAVGNVIGSNIFNILTVLGATATVGTITVSTSALRFDLPIMLAATIACLPIFYTDNQISRWEGILFIGYYIAYSAYLVMDAVGHDQIGLFSTVMLIFVIPLTVVTLLTLVWQHPDQKSAFTRSRAASAPPPSEAADQPTDLPPSSPTSTPPHTGPGADSDSP